ncbi:zinc-binding dehydrogenase [bacterium]|nr:zinc-binding dehydrogenase [bacterium]
MPVAKMKGRRVRITKPGATLAVEGFAVPDPGSGEVLVRLAMAGLNRLDIWVRLGIPGISYPVTPGSDGVGRIVTVGAGVPASRMGERVLLSPGVGDHLGPRYQIHGEHLDGTCTTHLARPASLWIPVPDGLPDEPAAACALTYLTAHTMLVRRAGLAMGETVLVWGAASGVGHAAGEVARAAGARTVGTARGGKAAALEGVGWDLLLDPDRDDVVAAVRSVTSGRGADVVVEAAGFPETFNMAIRLVRQYGTMMAFGIQPTPVIPIEHELMMTRQPTIIPSQGGHIPEPMAPIRAMVDMKKRGLIDPGKLVTHHLPFEELQKAYDMYEAHEDGVIKVVMSM